MSFICLDNALNLLLYVHSNLSIFLFQYLLLCFQIYILFLVFEDHKFVLHLIKRAVLSNQIGFVNCPLTVSGASYLNSLYMQIYH